MSKLGQVDVFKNSFLYTNLRLIQVHFIWNNALANYEIKPAPFEPLTDTPAVLHLKMYGRHWLYHFHSHMLEKFTKFSAWNLIIFSIKKHHYSISQISRNMDLKFDENCLHFLKYSNNFGHDDPLLSFYWTHGYLCLYIVI